MTVKQTSLFEGIAFGLLHLFNFRRAGMGWAEISVKGAAMVSLALLPTAMIFAAYMLLGHGEAIWQATVVSIFAKGPIPLADTRPQIVEVGIALALPTAFAAEAIRSSIKEGPAWRPIFVAAWAAGAIAGYLSVPNFFDHYALPLAVPVCVIASPVLGSKRGLLLFVTAACAASLLHETRRFGSNEGRQMEQLVEEIRPSLGGGCLYVYAGPLHPYSATGACHPSRFVFPDHLESQAEATALPVDPAVEVRRIMGAHPAVVLTAPRVLYSRNAEVEAILMAELAKNYRKGRTVKVGLTPVTVWHLKDATVAGTTATASRY
jgi:hypothetical protein